MKISLRAQTWGDVFAHLLIALLLLVLLVLGFFYVYLPGVTNHGQSVTVPDLNGMSMVELEEYLNERDLGYVVSDSVFEVNASPLTVMSQFPAPNLQVKQGRHIYVTIYAKNPPMIKMPNLVNRSVENARSELFSFGLQLGALTYVPDLQQNSVLRQLYKGSPIDEGTAIPKGAKIDLEVGDGLGNLEFEVPDIKGKPMDEAELVLRGSNLNIGSVIYDATSTEIPGYIIRQKPSAGNMIRVGDMVDIWVSGEGPQPDGVEEGTEGDDEVVIEDE